MDKATNLPKSLVFLDFYLYSASFELLDSGEKHELKQID